MRLLLCFSLNACLLLSSLLCCRTATGQTQRRPNVKTEDVTQQLIKAASQSTDNLEALIATGTDLNARDPKGNTAILWAVRMRNGAAIRALIETGADVNIANHSGSTPLMYAAHMGYPEIVQELIKAGARVNEKTMGGSSTLMMAAWSCNTEVVRELINAGATVSPQDWSKKRAPTFEEFPVKVIHSAAPAPVDFNSNPEAREYRTRLKEAASKGSNFAGHYALAEWGCGSNCQVLTVIDSENGKVLTGAGANRGKDFRVDSSLLIADPPYPYSASLTVNDDDPLAHMPIRYYVWNGARFDAIYEEACFVVNKHQTCGCEDVQEMIFKTTAN